MLRRDEAVNFILAEAKRLNEEEHIHELNDAKQYEQLSRVGCKISIAIMNFSIMDGGIGLKVDEIPDGSFLAVAMIANLIGVIGTIDEQDKFVDKLVVETGELGKSLAVKIIRQKRLIERIHSYEFFDVSDAGLYEYYGLNLT